MSRWDRSASGPSGRGTSGSDDDTGAEGDEGDDTSGLGVGADDGSPEHPPASSTTPSATAAVWTVTRKRGMDREHAAGLLSRGADPMPDMWPVLGTHRRLRAESKGVTVVTSARQCQSVCRDRLGRVVMRRSLVISLVAAVVAALCVGLTTASAAPSAGSDPDRLDAYTAVVQADQLSTIAQQGIDVSGQRPVANGIELDMVLDQAQADRLRGQGSRPEADPGQGRQDRPGVRGGAGRQRLQRLALVRRARRHPRPALRRGPQQPPAGEARGPRPHRPGSRDHRGQADPGRSRRSRTARVRPSSTAPPSTRVNGSPPRSTGG